MEKLTDNEIIKALECCMHSKSRSEGEKLQCPACKKQGCYFNNISEEDYPEGLIEGISISLLDLINRQQTQIEKLENIEHASEKLIKKQEEEIERLRKLLSGAKDCIDEIEYAMNKVGTSNDRVDEALEEWNNLVKEMTE